MAQDVRISPGTRIISATQLRLFRTDQAPIDFASDHIVILDANSRPVAECWPIERDPAVPAKPVLSTASQIPHRADSVDGTIAKKGILTESQRELLTRIWLDHPKHSATQIGEQFERRAGRPVSIITVNAYKPVQPGKASV